MRSHVDPDTLKIIRRAFAIANAERLPGAARALRESAAAARYLRSLGTQADITQFCAEMRAARGLV